MFNSLLLCAAPCYFLKIERSWGSNRLSHTALLLQHRIILCRGAILTNWDQCGSLGFLQAIGINCFGILIASCFVSVMQGTAPMSQPTSQPAPQQAPHPAAQQPPQPMTQRQEVINSAEILGQPEIPSNPLPFPSNTLRSSSPKPDPSEVYLKSRALLDSKRMWILLLYIELVLTQ